MEDYRCTPFLITRISPSPITNYNPNPQAAQHQTWTDTHTGKQTQGKQHLQTLTQHITPYTKHPETKFKGTTRKLKRRHITIDEIEYIGKETNRIELE